MTNSPTTNPTTRPMAGPPRRSRKAQAPLMLLAALSLLAGLWAGLNRLGWIIPPLPGTITANHGALMVNGFLGTVISLERAVALGRNLNRRRYYIAPVLSAAGGAMLLLSAPPLLSRVPAVLAALALVGIFITIYRLQPGTDAAVMGLAAALWLGGNLLWLAGTPVARVVPWWAAFLVLTIAGERLELARVLLMGKGARQTFIAAVGITVAGLLLSLVAADAGIRLCGVGLLALGLWLLRYDIARRTIRREGLTRFIAACLLPGYVWLVLSGLLWAIYGAGYSAGPIYDALLHTIFLGFVMSMIFGHAPVIIPSVMGVKVPYTPAFYAHLILLHVSLVVRVAGDLIPSPAARLWGGLFNEVAILLFLALTILSARRGRRL